MDTSDIKINGVILLDKKLGISSNNLLFQVKRCFNAIKAGYIGTLDPLATGMLPICFGKALKLCRYLSDADKRYLVTAKLGIRTDTSDNEGNIISIRPVLFNKSTLDKALSLFIGNIYQTPSIYSAIKYKGQPLYYYARQGIKVPPIIRLIKIYHIKLISWNFSEITLEVHCSKGTYIRTIIDDLGEILGCGAHVIMLRRLSLAHYSGYNMINLENLKKIIKKNLNHDLYSLLFPIESLVYYMPTINLIPSMATRIRFGQTVTSPHFITNGLVRMTEGKKKTFFGVGEINKFKCLIPKQIIF